MKNIYRNLRHPRSRVYRGSAAGVPLCSTQALCWRLLSAYWPVWCVARRGGWPMELGDGRSRDELQHTVRHRLATAITIGRRGSNSLSKRSKAFDPDLLGTQETLGFQRDYLAANLHGYDVLGVGRDDGQENGEMVALFYKRGRFEKIDGGHFWLSQTPDQPGSISWDSALPRMVTWVKLRDRHQDERKTDSLFQHSLRSSGG